MEFQNERKFTRLFNPVHIQTPNRNEQREVWNAFLNKLMTDDDAEGKKKRIQNK